MQQPAIFQEQGLEESPVLVPDVDVLANCYLVAGQLLHQSEVPRYPGKALRSAPKEIRKGLNSLIILVSWEVWKHRNSCIFENARPSTSLLLQTVADECSVWGMAGATKLQELLVRSLTPPA
uniref:Uncharacterized protein n=1 Tax=Setaria viridis TaxID=4556 RepID=A0A4U6TTN5_SETVI|nr:hypothetical protein SEVIR_7G110800v2 [Setaria viridis]